MAPSARVFRCENPDFTVRSIPDGDSFNVRKECLIRGSDVFRRLIILLPEFIARY